MNYTLLFCKLITILIGALSCKIGDGVFNDRSFYMSIDGTDSFTSLHKCMKLKNSDSCLDNYRHFENIDYLKYVEEHGNDIGKLPVLTDDIIYYIENEDIKEFLLLATFLYDNNHVTSKLYDDMLNIYMEKDTTNLVANYELAKLRYMEGYLGLSHFLIDNLHALYPENVEVKRIKEEYGDQTYDKSMDFKEYLDLNPYYIEP